MVITRFAPSPTGFLHLGGARTALFSWLTARTQQGKFLLRIEDTDAKRHVPGAVEAILAGLHWLGLDWDGEVVFQSQRLARYREVLAWLEAKGTVYRCYCTPERLEQLRAQQVQAQQTPCYDQHCRDLPALNDDTHRPYVLRFRTPNSGSVIINDTIRGQVEIQNQTIDDWVVARSDGSFTYNFCVVIDDADAKVTHVVRGEEHLNNTPKQIHLLEALHLPIPVYAHAGVILDLDGKKLSKRSGASDLLSYKSEGFLPEALMNSLARLGWSHNDQELFDKHSLLQLFKLEDVKAAPSCFDLEKLRWQNQQHMQMVSLERLVSGFQHAMTKQDLADSSDLDLMSVLSLYRSRSHTLNEVVEQARNLWRPTPASPEALQAYTTPAILNALLDVYLWLKDESAWNNASLKLGLKQRVQKNDLTFPQVAVPLRLHLLGVASSPSLHEILALLPQATVLERLEDRMLPWIKKHCVLKDFSI